MREDAEARRGLIDRFGTLQERMCQISEEHVPSEPEYMEMFIDNLRDLGMGCITESFIPTRLPSCIRDGDSYVGVCRMEVLDIATGLTVRFGCRTVGHDRAETQKDAFDGVFASAGLTVQGRDREFRFMDIGPSEYSGRIGTVGADVPYASF